MIIWIENSGLNHSSNLVNKNVMREDISGRVDYLPPSNLCVHNCVRLMMMIVREKNIQKSNRINVVYTVRDSFDSAYVHFLKMLFVCIIMHIIYGACLRAIFEVNDK